jgi:hypothetical protein
MGFCAALAAVAEDHGIKRLYPSTSSEFLHLTSDLVDQFL